MEDSTNTPETPQPAAEATEGRSLRSLLEEEGNIAADYVEALLDILDMDGDIDIYVENRRSAISVVGDTISTRRLRKLVGDNGEVLDALQELTRLAVHSQTGERSRCMVDVAGYRAKQKSDLQVLAADAVKRCSTTGEPISLEPMTAFERKVVHDVVTAAGLKSSSQGEEPYRYIVISPASSDSAA